MPNWKKVIVSGSDASLNTLNVSNGITGSLFGTASNVQGGSTYYLPLWNTNNSLTSSYLYQSGSILKTIYNNQDRGLTLDYNFNSFVLGNAGVGNSTYIQVYDGGSTINVYSPNYTYFNDKVGVRIIPTNPGFAVSGALEVTGPGPSKFMKTDVQIDGNLFMSGAFRLIYNNDNTNNMLFGMFDGSSIYGPYYQLFGNNYSNTTQRGSAEFVYDNRNGGGSGFNIASFNGSTWTRKFRVDDNGAQVTGSLEVTNGITGSLLGTGSYALSALSSSYAIKASSADSATSATSSSYAVTSSYSNKSSLADIATNANTASYVLNAVSSSFASKASTADLATQINVTSPAIFGGNLLYVINSGSATVYTSPIGTDLLYFNDGQRSLTVTSSYAYTASNADLLDGLNSTAFAQLASANRFTANQTITGSLTATGDIITQGNLVAQQFIISSSVAYFTESFSSGSTMFGNSLDDTHKFTGSVLITGSSTIEGAQTIIPPQGSGNQYVGIIISGSNTNGGANYIDFLRPVNTGAGASNINKFFRLNPSGDIEIVNSAYSGVIYSLSDSGNGSFLGGLGVGVGAPTTPGLIRASNDVVAFYSSDRRLKDNIKPIQNSLDKLSKINGCEFDWIPKEGIHENEGHDVGVIADEIENVLPEIVTTRDNGYKAVKYEKIVPLLIEAIKELKAEVDRLKSGNYNNWD